MILLSIPGLFRTLLIIIGVLIVLRIVGRMMIAKRNLEQERELLKRQRLSEKMMEESKQNYGKTTIGNVDKKAADQAGYVDFEEVK